MAFALSKYIYPIQEKLVLSETLGIELDNPRTEKELKLVKDHIRESSLSASGFFGKVDVPLQALLISSIGVLFDKLKDDESKNGYALEIFGDSYKIKDIVQLLAEMWIIIRFPDDKNNFFGGLLLMDNGDWRRNNAIWGTNKDYAESFNRMKNYCSFLSLMISESDDQYHGESFLLNSNFYDIFNQGKSSEVDKTIRKFIDSNNSIHHTNIEIYWDYWLGAYQSIINQAELIEKTITTKNVIDTDTKKKGNKGKHQSAEDKLLHIGSILSAAYQQTINPELMLLLLVSSIEYMLTRNPDTNRFNIEDSITRQFKLKTAVVIHQQNRELVLEDLEKELKRVYSLRSDIAHGNYKDNFDINEVVRYTYKLFQYVRYIMKEYMANRDLVEFLKRN